MDIPLFSSHLTTPLEEGLCLRYKRDGFERTLFSSSFKLYSAKSKKFVIFLIFFKKGIDILK